MTPRAHRRFSESARGGRRGTPSRKSGRGGTLIGIFVGLALGLALAAGVAYWLLRAGNPYQPSVVPKESAREPAKATKADPAVPEKPRFDFYKILPGVEEPKVQPKAAERPAPDKATVDRAAVPDKAADRAAKADERSGPGTPPSDKAAKAGDRFWLQAGSFATEADAETLKARLALAGWEAAVQAATIPDKGLRYRVRLGPYDNTDELKKVKGDLASRGFDVAVIKY
ncbi:MAG: SPOR domain-containing protein [Betaproteobacteria bacterium]